MRFAHVLIQSGRKRDERLPQVPTVYELMDELKTDKAGRRLATVILASGDLGRPYLLPPGVPAEGLKLLHETFVKLMPDAEYLADVKKRGLEVAPSTDEDRKVGERSDGPTAGGHRVSEKTHVSMTLDDIASRTLSIAAEQRADKKSSGNVTTGVVDNA